MRRKDEHYIPILKGRLGEFRALKEVDDSVAGRYTPLIEFVASGDEFYDEDGNPTRSAVERSIIDFGERLRKHWPKSHDLMVDLRAAPTFDGYIPMVTLLEQFEEEALIPVCRPSDLLDQNDPIRQIRNTLSLLNRTGICIRLADEDLEERDEPISKYLYNLLEKFHTSPENVDLVVDFGAVNEESAAFAARIARLVVMDLPYLDRWRSITLAAGAFPANLDSVPAFALTELPRSDAAMWLAVKQRLRDGMRVPSFGDYAIAYPRQLAGVPFAPAPQVRYTVAGSWLVLKGRRSDRRSNAQFFDISAQIMAHRGFTPDLSWGDRQIHSKAMYADVDPLPVTANPGNAMIWRAIGTSHHIAWVIDRLARVGEP